MAYTYRNISLAGDFAGQKLWHYKTEDTHAVVSASGYFNAAVKDSNLETGDLINAAVGVGGTMQMRAYVVTVATNGTVTTAQLTTA